MTDQRPDEIHGPNDPFAPRPESPPEPPPAEGGPPDPDPFAPYPDPPTGLTPLPKRLIDVFLSPGKLMEEVAAHPRWAGVLAVSIVAIVLAMVVTPPELMLEAQRRAALDRGQDFQITDQMVQVMRFAVPAGAAISVLIFTFLFAGLYTVIFAFILGDEGSYKQYLAALAHSGFIGALLALALTPLRISSGDPQFTLNLASFLFFLPDGFVYNFFRALDITQIWGTLVFAQGVHSIDRRRSFTSAAAISLTLLAALALLGAWVATRFG